MGDSIAENYLGKYRVKLDPQYFIEKWVLEKGVWEPHINELLKCLVRPGMQCIDVGANAGFVTIPIADRVGPAGKVFAFEPNSLTFPRLVDNINLNPEFRGVIIPEKLGLGNEPTILKVFLAGAHGNAYLSDEYNPKLSADIDPTTHSDICIIRTLDELFPDQHIDFIKVDVEGMEFEVLTGGTNLLQRCKPVLLYETLLDAFEHHKLLKLEKFLEGMGYGLFAMGRDGKLRHTHYPRYIEDTVAIDMARAHEFYDVMPNAGRFALQFDSSAPLELLGANDLTICSVAPGIGGVTLGADSESPSHAGMIVNQSQIEFRIGNKEPLSFNLAVEGDALDRLRGVVSIGVDQIPVSGNLIAGALTFI